MDDLTRKKLDNIAKDLGSKATDTPVPKIPFEETPTHPDKNNRANNKHNGAILPKKQYH